MGVDGCIWVCGLGWIYVDRGMRVSELVGCAIWFGIRVGGGCMCMCRWVWVEVSVCVWDGCCLLLHIEHISMLK